MVKKKTRKVEEIGRSLLRGGEGKDHEIRFRGKEYVLFRNAFYKEAIRIGKDLKSDGYDVRFTNATFDGAVLNIYTKPALPDAPAHRYSYGKRLPMSERSEARITPKVPKLR